MSVLSRLRSRERGRLALRSAALQRVQHARSAWTRARRGTKARSAAYHLLVREKRTYATRKEQVAGIRRSIARHLPSRAWGGSRAVTDEVVRIVGGRAPITSRKRTATYGNPRSDHHVSQRNADAVDFGVADAHWLKNEISRRLGGPSSLPDYGSFRIRRFGRWYRVQIIAGTHGTGPHLHVGVRRA